MLTFISLLSAFISWFLVYDYGLNSSTKLLKFILRKLLSFQLPTSISFAEVDLVVHAAGPFQGADKCTVLEAAISTKVRTVLIFKLFVHE